MFFGTCASSSRLPWRCTFLAIVLWFPAATAARAQETTQKLSLHGSAATGAMAFRERDEHYSPLIYRGWLWTVAGQLQVEGRLGRLTLAGAYATGRMDADVPEQSAQARFGTLSLGADRAVLRREIKQIPFRLHAGLGLRSTTVASDFGDNPAAPGSPFTSSLWSHSVWLGMGADARLGARTTVALRGEAAVVSRVARPAYGLATQDVSPFAGRWYSPIAALQTGADVRARIRLVGPLDVGAAYVFHYLRAPDPLPVRTFHHALLVSLEASL